MIKSIITVILIFGTLTIIAHYNEGKFIQWGSYLILALFVLIIYGILEIIFYNGNNFFGKYDIYAIATIIIFSGLILYDTDVIRLKGMVHETLRKENIKIDINYTNDSLGLYLDILNMLSSVIRIF
jgi:FtsH-binding integral membrane protein